MRVSLPVRSLLLAFMTLVPPAARPVNIILSIAIAPPPLPIYEQPVCPGIGYLWTPGYWAYSDDGFFWVPGTWVLVPEPGLLWTPGYWGWSDGLYVFYPGYWGPRVGFYGGINYGFGYFGVGYQGGYWNNGVLFYNRSVNRVTNVRNVYNQRVIVNNITYVSYNGGPGGIAARPTAQEQAAAGERHIQPTSVQTQHVQVASANRQLYESVNRGKPRIAASARPTELSGHGVVGAKAAAKTYQPPTARTVANSPARSPENIATPRRGAGFHPNDLPPVGRPSVPNTGNARVDQKYRQQQEGLRARQDQERQKLQRRQEQEHRRAEQARADARRQPQLDQKHQQQTRRLEQKQANEQQKLQERQQQANRGQARPGRPNR